MFDISALVTTFGYLGVAAIVFAESGLLIGMFLPGDSLLFTAGVLASQGLIDIIPLVFFVTIAAVIGDNFGYWLGHRFGHAVFRRKGSIFLDPAHIERAQRFYARYGARALVIARFTPIVRTIVPVLAGVGSMDRRVFMQYNLIGALLWGTGVPLLGYWLGSTIPHVDRYLLPIIALIVLTSIAPTAWHIIRERMYRQ